MSTKRPCDNCKSDKKCNKFRSCSPWLKWFKSEWKKAVKPFREMRGKEL